MKKYLIPIFVIVLLLSLVGCAEKKPTTSQETVPQETVLQEPETQSATLCIFKEPVILAKTEFEVDKHIFFNRKHSASIDEIEGLRNIINSIDNWSTEVDSNEDITVDGYFGLSDEEYLFYYSYSNNILFYETFSMDEEVGKVVNVVRHYAKISESNMEYIKNLQNSKDGFIG